MFYPRSSSSGSGTGVNFILNPDAESDTSGWATYQDAAGATPVDGTGGSPTVTWTRSTSSPLTGTASFVLTKDAANRQGEGASYAFTIDSASQAKVLAIEFDYIVGSGTFVAGAPSVDSDVEVYIYDVTNAVVIQPSSYKLFSNSSTIASHFVANFQTASNSTSYRLILHCATTSASAYTLKFDTVKVGPSQYVYGTPITDWAAYTPTISSGFGSCTGVSFFYRRVAGSLEVNGTFTAGTAAGALGTFTLPSGLSLDSAKLSIANTSGNPGPLVGDIQNNGSVNQRANIVTTTGTSTVLVYATDNTIHTGTLTPTNVSTWLTGGAVVGVKFSVPILGWPSAVQMSDNANLVGEVSARYTNVASTSIANSGDVKVPFATKDYDTLNAFLTDTYTIPVAGRYRISCTANFASSLYGAANTIVGSIYKNTVIAVVGPTTSVGGAVTDQIGVMVEATLNLIAGDTIDFRVSNNRTAGATNLFNQTGSNSFQIERIGGSPSVAATETIAMSYSDVAGVTLTNAFATQTYGTKLVDTHGAYASGVFMTPAAGRYAVNAAMGTQPFNVAGSTFALFLIANKGATQFAGGWAVGSGATMSLFASLDGLVNCNAGETLAIQVKAAAAIIGYTGFGFNTFTVKRIGI